MRSAAQFALAFSCGIAWFLACTGHEAVAQDYPVKPIRILVGFTTGGGGDITARLLAQALSEHLGRSVVVENRPGASGSIANERVVTSPPDGYTLLLLQASSIIQSALRVKLPYDLQRDLAPISFVATGPYVLVVHPSVPARDVKALVALARAQPGKLSYGSAGMGSAGHLAGELFNLLAKVSIIQVPYKGAADTAVATAGGQIDVSYPGLTGALPLIEAGKLRPLAVTSAKRTSLMPSMPTIHESGLPGYDRSGWYGVLAPARVPGDIIARLNAAISHSVNTPEMKDSFNKQGLEPQTSTPEQLASFIRREMEQNAKLIRMAGVKPE